MLRRIAPTLAAIIVTALCLAASNWQRHRMHYKEGLRAQYERAVASPPLDATDLPRTSGDWAALRYAPVRLTGTFDAAHQILLDNRVEAGQVGYEVLTPFRFADDRVVLVDRGWVPQGRTRAEVPGVPPPAGTVTLAGRIALPPQGYVALGTERPGTVSSVTPGRPPIWQHLDLKRYGEVTGIAAMPILVEQTSPAIPGDALVRVREAPDFGIDTHRMYMLQWLAFAGTTIVFWAVAHRPRRWRRQS